MQHFRSSLRFVLGLFSLAIAFGIPTETYAQPDSLYFTPMANYRFLVFYPVYITEGQYSGDYDIFAGSFFADGNLEWSSSKPKAISTAKYREFAPVAMTDSNGGAYLVYTVENPGGPAPNDRDILMRHVDRDGKDLWGDTASPVVIIAQSKYSEQNPRLVQSPDGTIMIFFEVHYGTSDVSSDVDVAAVKIGMNGIPIWQGGVWIANSKRRERLAGAVSDGRGGGIAVLEPRQFDSSGTMTGSDITAVHVNAAGEIGWQDSQQATIIAGSRHLERNSSVISDGFGGAYIAYELAYSTGDRSGDVDILAQHINSYGVREWTDEAAPPIVSSTDKAREYAPSIALDSSGIVIAFRVDYFGERKPLYLVGVQRMDSRGKLLWNEGKKPKLMGVIRRMPDKPQVITDRNGNIFVVFEGRDTTDGNRDIYAQKLERNSTLLWGNGEEPIPVFATADIERDAVAAPDGNGGLVVVAVREFVAPDHAGISNILAQHMRPDGVFAWEAFRSPLSLTATTMKDGPPVMVVSR
jgi:hypothetical protein